MKINRIFKIQLAAALLLATINSQLFTARALGGPTPATTTQTDPRTPISSAPFTISVSGSYYLTKNLTLTSSSSIPRNGITIAANNVTLDLNGFTISSTTAASTTVGGIMLNSGVHNITIMNGFIQGGAWINNSGGYSGNGFGYGIYYSGNPPANVVVSKVSVANVLDDGINLFTLPTMSIHLTGSLVEACTVTTAGGYGICANTIKDSVANDCGNIAIVGIQAVDCIGISVDSGIVTGCAQNCFGMTSSTSTTTFGISADLAQNCFGISTNSGGLSASTAQNCFGKGYNGTGLQASYAQNCNGSSDSDTGLSATIAQNCYGISDSGTGLDASFMANSCLGSSSSGTGLSAFYGNFCFGSSSSGTPVDVITKYNMP
jgi:hypothetical protein